jgi:hypothetical protein
LYSRKEFSTSTKGHLGAMMIHTHACLAT